MAQLNTEMAGVNWNTNTMVEEEVSTSEPLPRYESSEDLAVKRAKQLNGKDLLNTGGSARGESSKSQDKVKKSSGESVIDRFMSWVEKPLDGSAKRRAELRANEKIPETEEELRQAVRKEARKRAERNLAYIVPCSF